MNVCAAIVTYHPDVAELRANLAALRPQVDAVVLVDNASRPLLLDAIREIAAEFDCALLENSANLGVAAALNRAVDFARQHDAAFLLCLDQDSGVSADFVAQQLATYERESRDRRIGLVAPTVVTRPSGEHHQPVRLRLGRHTGTFLLAQTSGALHPLALFEEVGLFRAEMFMDYIDYEFCLRLDARGWSIAWASAAELDHRPGNPALVRVFGRTVLTVNQPPDRHYYEVRNCLWLVRNHAFAVPEMCLRLLLGMVRRRVHALLFEPGRRAKLAAIFQGIGDALRNRLGPRRC